MRVEERANLFGRRFPIVGESALGPVSSVTSAKEFSFFHGVERRDVRMPRVKRGQERSTRFLAGRLFAVAIDDGMV